RASSPEPRAPLPHEHNLAQAALLAMRAAGLPGRVGIASSKLGARIAAELPKSPHIVAPGEEAQFLAPLPLERLGPEMKIAATLRRWGIESIGQLANLPEGEVATRLGELGRALHCCSRGIDTRPLIPRQAPPEFREGMDFEWPIVTLEPFLFMANAALDRLMRRMEGHGYSCRTIEVALRLEPEGFHVRAIDLPAPTRDVKTILTLIRLDLESAPPGAPVTGFTFIAHPDRPREGQLSIFGPSELSPDLLATTVAKIAAMVGADRVGTPRTIDAWRPERYGIARYDPPSPPSVRRAPRRWRGLLAVRVFRPPLAVEVISDGAAPSNGGTFALGDLHLREIHTIRNVSKQEGYTPRPLEIHGAVRVASGPWSLEEGWWSDDPVERDYWDVEMVGGGIYRVYRARAEGEWYVDGIYD
ncbi:MAG: hypothetical protein WBX15_19105, partial [Thermoanaerobaculia bacterium]